MDLAKFFKPRQQGGAPAQKKRRVLLARNEATPSPREATAQRCDGSEEATPRVGGADGAAPCAGGAPRRAPAPAPAPTSTPAPPAVPLPSGISVRPCGAEACAEEVRTLNVGLLPMRYPERFYRELPKAPQLCWLARAGGDVVGAIAARIETDRATKAPNGALYIMTLAVVGPQRRTGVGRALLATLLQVARRDAELRHVDRIELHVHAANSDALAFYEAAGFARLGVVERYYPRLEPPDAVHLRLALRRERQEEAGSAAGESTVGGSIAG